MKTNTNIEELEHKNNLVLQNLERLSRYYPNIGELAEESNIRIEMQRLDEIENNIF